MMNNYSRFLAMITTSTLVMFGLMYLNTYQIDHLFFSETRAYMALIMGASMSIIMLTFMLKMYTNRGKNIRIYIISVSILILALWLVRSQTTVNDVSYMKAMIPHHSIAILTSERAQITDPRVRELADQIIEAQREEIREMKNHIKDLESKE
jgi:FlaA1/EpsC-like NDP-sugar epimerase